MVSAVRRGKPLREVARRFRVSVSTVHYWVDRAEGQRLTRVDWRDRSHRPHHIRRTKRSIENLILKVRTQLKDVSKLDLQAQPRGCIIYLRRTDARGRVSLLGHSFIVDRTWPHRLVRAHVDLIAEQIKFFALRRREPNWHRLLNTVAYHLPKRKFIDVRKFSNN